MDYPATRPLIGITGHKGAGKDTVAGILTRLYGYERKAWADALKLEVYRAFGAALLHYTHGPTYIPTFQDWREFVDAHKYDTPDTPYGWLRPLLQFWGTEYRRNLCGSDYWTRQLQLGPGAAVSDCRFPNEVEAIRNAGGIMWRVDRPNYTGDVHTSEAYIDSLRVDAVIENSGTLEQLETRVILHMIALEYTRG